MSIGCDIFYIESVGRKGIISGNVLEMPCIIQRKYTDMAAAANFESIYAAIGCDDPWRLFGISSDGAHQMQRQIADGPGVRKNGDALTLMFLQDFVHFVGRAAQQLAVTFAFFDDVIYGAVNQSVIIAGESYTRFFKGQTLQNADVSFAESGTFKNRDVCEPRKVLCRLNGTAKIAGINCRNAFTG